MTDVVICGGGVIGAAAAYYLSQRGASVSLVEANEVAHGASGYSGGLISAPRFEFLESPLAPILSQSYAMHGELAETLPDESGIDYRFRWSPSPVVAAAEHEAEAFRAAADATDGARWLDPTQLREISPLLDGEVLGGYLGPPTGQLDSYLYTRALLQAAERNGARLVSGRVDGLARDGDRVRGARLASGDIVAGDAVVVAMGPWSVAAGEWLGSEVPVEPLKGQILRLQPAQALPLAGFSNADGDYVMAKASGLVYTGTTEERAGFDRRPTREARDAIRAFGAAFAPKLGAMPVAQQTACLRPLSADDLPIIGPAPALAGAYLATGHGRKGVLMSPATGRALAELIVDGAASSLDLSPFDPARFAP